MARLFGRGSPGRYGFLGFIGITIDLVAYGLLISLSVPPIGASAISILFGILANYAVNALLNFQAPLNFRQTLRFVTVGVAGLVIATFLLSIALALNTDPWWGKIFSMIAVGPAQYVANLRWTFR